MATKMLLTGISTDHNTRNPSIDNDSRMTELEVSVTFTFLNDGNVSDYLDNIDLIKEKIMANINYPEQVDIN